MKEEEREGSILEFFRILVQWRKQDEVLQYGQYHDLNPDHPKLYYYERTLGEKSRFICLNFSDEPSELPEELKAKKLVLSNYNESGDLLRPWEARLYMA